ncbi:unnamed protein product [Mycena citricolor]|uniref:Uncharacterized protein n=1 Tax=Mycena citricolor TaxID=2018698 RepID=A0AAD2HJS8_9AGAR|nr:unnamed protein product [Mycena citricolor]
MESDHVSSVTQLHLPSGVGLRDDLAPLDIPLVKHLPGVGAHLIMLASRSFTGFPSLTALIFSSNARWLQSHNCSNTCSPAGGFSETSPSGARPSGSPRSAGTFSIMLTAVRPQSTSSVKLASADPESSLSAISEC